MQVLGEVVLQVMAFSTGLLVLVCIGMGIYMRVSRRDPFTGKDMPQPRSTYQLLYLLFQFLMFFTLFASYLVPQAFMPLRFTLLGLGIVSLGVGILFFFKFLRYPAR